MKKRFYIAVVFVLVLFLGLFVPKGQGISAEKAQRIQTVALIPYGIFVVDDLSIDVTHFVTEELKKYNVNVIEQEALENFLASKRIRRTDFLDRSAIRAMGSALNVDALVMGNVSIISGGENPHLSISTQIIDCMNASVIWANSISRTGADYAGFLGLGRITSLEKLLGIVVGELFGGLPSKISLNNSSPAPFEIVRASFFPDTLRSGETAQLSMEIKEIVGKVRDIRAFILDTEIKLGRSDENFYGGILTAPPIEGKYPLAVFITDRWNRLFGMEAVATLTVHNTPPKITLSSRQKLISPNKDGIMESTLFVPEVLKTMALKSWKVEIANDEGQVVRIEEGLGSLPRGFLWRGVDYQNRPVKDGTYFCRLIAEDEAGNKTSVLSDKVIVDVTSPEVTVVIQKESEESIVLALKINDRSAIDYWELAIFDISGQEIERFEGKGNVPETVNLAVKKKAQMV